MIAAGGGAGGGNVDFRGSSTVDGYKENEKQ